MTESEMDYESEFSEKKTKVRVIRGKKKKLLFFAEAIFSNLLKTLKYHRKFPIIYHKSIQIKPVNGIDLTLAIGLLTLKTRCRQEFL